MDIQNQLSKPDLFEEKAQDWDANERIQKLSTAIGAAILEQLPLAPTMHVMDFGAGTGLISGHIAPRVASILAVDVSQGMLDKLAAKPQLQGKVTTLCQDITEQPLNERFDLIMSAMALHHVEDTEQLLASLAAHLKSGGRAALADLDPEDGSFHPEDTEGVFHRGFDRQKLQKLMEKSGFENVHFITAHTVNKEGRDYPVFLVTGEKPGQGNAD